MDLKERIKLHRQTATAIETYDKYKSITILQSSNDGKSWKNRPLDLTRDFSVYTYYRIAEPEPKKVKYYRPIILSTTNFIDTSYCWKKSKNFDSIPEFKVIGWDERTFDIPEKE